MLIVQQVSINIRQRFFSLLEKRKTTLPLIRVKMLRDLTVCVALFMKYNRSRPY